MDDSFAKGLRVLEVLAAAEKPLGLTEIAARCKLIKSHAHKFLRTLLEQNYVEQPQPRGPYRLTFKLLELGSRALSRADLISAARGPMQDISARTRETSTIGVYENGDIMYVYKVDGTHEVRTNTDIGRRRPAYCVAAGKAMLAFQAPAVVANVTAHMKRHTGRTITTAAKLRDELAGVRKSGYAVNWGEWIESVRGIAAPIRNADGSVIAALNLSIPAERLDKKAAARLAPLVIDAANRISRGLGAIAPDER
jgi:IclR family KDG regulon transcriptional repressor